MKLLGAKGKLKGNSGLAIAAGLAVVFMFIATIISIVLYQRRMKEAEELLAETTYSTYDSYVVMISTDSDLEFWGRVYETAKEYGKDYGVYVDMFSDSIDESYTKQEYLEMAIESDCDAIFVEADDSEETADLLARANKADIAVFTINSDSEMENRISYIGANSYTIAGLYGHSLIENLSTQRNVMVVGSDPDEASNFVNNIQTFLASEEIETIPLEFDIRTLEEDEAFAEEEYVQNLFMENDLDPVVICLDEEMSTSFYQAMIDYNKVGQILLYANNRSDTILTGISQGVITGTVYVDAGEIGQAACQAFVEYRDLGYVSDYISVDPQLVDSANIEELLGEVADE